MIPLSEHIILQELSKVENGVFGHQVHYRTRIDSTNNLARELAERDAPEGTLVITDEQTAGRGRYQRSWVAPPGSSLLMSLIFRPGLAPAQAHRLIMVCGLSITDAIEQLTGLEVAVKWPNDLLVSSRKFCGILPESAMTGHQLDWVIVGMGINVNQHFPPDDPLSETGISLRDACGHTLDRVRLLASVMAGINRWYQQLDADVLDETWRRRCVSLGQMLRISYPGGKLEGIAEDIAPSGALWLRTNDGERHQVAIGEATVLKP